MADQKTKLNKTKIIKQYYYRMYISVHQQKKGKEQDIEGFFDFLGFLAAFSRKPNQERNIQDQDTGNIVRLDYFKSDAENANLLRIHFEKLNAAPNEYISKVTKLSDSLEQYNVPLNADEYLTDDLSGIFDETNYVLTLQKNISCLSESAISAYLSYMTNELLSSEYSEAVVKLEPIFDQNVFSTASHGKLYKKISFKTANTYRKAKGKIFKAFNNPVLQSLKSVNDYFDGLNIEVTVTPASKTTDSAGYLDTENMIKMLS
ncbi:DUF6731 family protein [Oenococcus alcoholitolerans]|uniref:DUF6731 family protein n=1 Tax=Oenococcus alcoholitolerans TaxID=931074 RepID=UPI003F70B023